jgi:GntR family transcriptional regulator
MQAIAEIRQAMARERGPLALRLRHAFLQAIDQGLLAPGKALPPERDLAADLGVSRSTLRDCLASLAAENRIETRRGTGSVVKGEVRKALTRLSGFTEDMRARGLEPSSRVLERVIGPVPPEIAFRTGLPLATPVMRIARLRYAGGEIFSYEHATVPLSVVGADYDGTGSLYARMAERGLRPRRILQSLQAVAANTDLAAKLGLDPGAALLEITQVGYAEGGQAVEDSIGWYRGDRYRYVGEITG